MSIDDSGSPMDENYNDRRSHERAAVTIPVEVTLPDARIVTLRATDLGCGGLRIQGAQELSLAPGASVGLRFELPEIAEPLVVPGKIRWCAPTRGEVGIAFGVGLRTSEVRALQRWLEGRIETGKSRVA